MGFLDLLKLSLRMFRARTMRTLLTILGMSVGIAAILFLVSLGYGLQKTVLEKITTADSLVTLDVTSNANNQAILDETTVKKLGSLPGVAEVSPAIQFGAQGKFQSVRLDLDAVATTPTFLALAGLKPGFGKFFTTGEQKEIIITTGIAKIFGQEPQAMLDQVIDLSLFTAQETAAASSNPAKKNQESLTLPQSYTVVGVIESDENLAYFPLETIQEAIVKEYNQLKIKCQSTETMGEVRAAVLQSGFDVSSLSETVDQANKVFSAVQMVLLLFGVIALVVSAIGMFNTMTIALLERTEEIGIMKSIGADKRSLSLMFLFESTLMGFLGGFGGVVLGFLGGTLANSLINVIAARFGGQSVDLFYAPPWFVGMIILFGALVGFLTGIFPARKATHIDTLEALRYK